MVLVTKLTGGKLTVTVDIDKVGVLSSTEKNFLHVNTGGFTPVDIQIDGKPVRLNLMVITPNK